VEDRRFTPTIFRRTGEFRRPRQWEFYATLYKGAPVVRQAQRNFWVRKFSIVKKAPIRFPGQHVVPMSWALSQGPEKGPDETPKAVLRPVVEQEGPGALPN
jgi:hypothetical protein